MIPRKIHVIWIGDQNQFPEECVLTWRQQHPDWELTVWDNEALASYRWRCGDAMRQLQKRDLRGVADCMRWDILFNEGGVVVDADMVSLRPLPEWLQQCQVFMPWLNELACPGALSSAVVGAEPGNALIAEMLLRIQDDPELASKPIMEATGAGRLLALRKQHQYQGLTPLPSHFFLPRLPKIAPYEGSAPVYGYKKCYAAMGGRAATYQAYLTPFFPGGADHDVQGPFFTVGIANYNRSDYVAQAITSVLEHDYSHFELLIVDDGSTDESQAVVTSFNDRRIRFVQKEHSGIPRTVNRVLAEARGSHVIWMGNDDLCLPGLLREYARLIQTWPEVVFAYGELIKIDSQGKNIDLLPYPDLFGDRTLLSRFLVGNVVPGPGSMANLAVMRAVGGFDNDIPFSNDYDLWARLAATGLPFKHIGRATCKYRWHGSNISNRAQGLVADELQVLQKMLATYTLKQICADLDWAHQPESAEIQACKRIAGLLTRKKDPAGALLWEQRQLALQQASVAG